jgi:hypothetical protein
MITIMGAPTSEMGLISLHRQAEDRKVKQIIPRYTTNQPTNILFPFCRKVLEV